MTSSRFCSARSSFTAKGATPTVVVFLFLVLLSVTGGITQPLQFPALTSRVVDQADVIPASNRSALETKLEDLEDKSSIQLVVATVKSLQGKDVETFANELFRSWKIGQAKQNNGVLLLVAPSERKVRIEVGYGLEGTLTDALSSVIISGAIIPRFKVNDFSGGIDRGVDGIISVLTTDAAEWKPATSLRTDHDQGLIAQLMPFILFLLLLLIFRAMTRQANRGLGGYGRRSGTVFFPSGASSWGGGSFGGGGGSFGGGFGGFSGGGGSSGGGGASGSW